MWAAIAASAFGSHIKQLVLLAYFYTKIESLNLLFHVLKLVCLLILQEVLLCEKLFPCEVSKKFEIK